MHIKMEETRRGSPDGHIVALYHAGDIYEVPDGMGKRFVRDGWATEIHGEVVPPSPISPLGQAIESMVRNSAFRPQPTRGSAPTNVAPLIAKGVEL